MKTYPAEGQAEVRVWIRVQALKFTEMGEVRIQVTAADGMFTVTVADTGPGIAAAEQQKIFEEF